MQKVTLLLLLAAGAAWAQNPNPCRSVQNSATSGQVLSAATTGSSPQCKWIAGGGGGGSGTVTSISAGNGLTASPNPITTTGTISGINAAADGATKGVAVFTAADFNSSAGLISIDYTNGQKATAGQPGFLTAADWNTFNGKQAAGSYITALTGDVTATGPGSVSATIANDAVTTVKILNANVTAAKMVNAGVFTGDVTTTFPAVTVAKVNGIAYSATGAAHSVPVVTTANTTATYKAVPDCTDTGGNHLNFTQSTDAFSCGTSGGSTGITIGTTTITSGTSTRVLYDNAGVVGEYTVSGTGTALCLTTSCTMVTPVLGTPTSGTLTNATGLPCASGITNNFGCLIEKHTASSTATLDFTTCFTSTYDDYVFKLVNVIPSTNTQDLRMLVSTNGGSSYDTSSIYNYGTTYVPNTGTAGILQGSSVAQFVLFTVISNSANLGGVSGYINFANPLSASLFKYTTYNISAQQGSANYNGVGAGSYASATAVNAVRFLFASGNVSSGTISCYGIAKS